MAKFNLTRRQFMVGCSSAIAAMAGSRITQMAIAAPTAPEANSYESVIVVFLRGGIDGMNAVLPLSGQDRAIYEAARPNLKVPVSGVSGQYAGAGQYSIGSLNGVPFGLHPGLAAFHELYNLNAFAVIHATGLTNSTRSHFDAMQFMETATPGIKTATSGWITRHLASMGLTGTDLIPALSAGSSPAMSLMGRDDLITMTGTSGFDIGEPWNQQSTDDRRLVLRKMYSGQNWLHTAGDKTLNAWDTIDRALGDYTPSPNAGYIQYNPFSDQLKTIAQIIKANLGLRAATIDLGGWDTHERQQQGRGDPRGYFYNLLESLSRSLRAFFFDLADGPQRFHTRTTVVVMSEFGRTFHENDNDGTDHGHGNVIFVIGGNVNRGIFGSWPGLTNLDEGRDLRITTDYRAVLSEILSRRAGNPNVASVFPGFTPTAPLGFVR